MTHVCWSSYFTIHLPNPIAIIRYVWVTVLRIQNKVLVLFNVPGFTTLGWIENLADLEAIHQAPERLNNDLESAFFCEVKKILEPRKTLEKQERINKTPPCGTRTRIALMKVLITFFFLVYMSSYKFIDMIVSRGNNPRDNFFISIDFT